MLRNESHIREARADTQIHRAPRDYLERLATLYGLPLQATETPHLSQRAFIHQTLYSVRGSYTALINQLAGLFSHLIEQTTATLTPAPFAPYLTSPEITEAWGEERLIRVSGALYHSTHYSSATSRLYLSPARSLAISGAPTSGSAQSVDVELLPFVIREPQPAEIKAQRGRIQEAPCVVIIDMISPETEITPPSYLRENADARTNDPFGAHVLDLFSATEDERNGGQPPYPLYFTASDFGRPIRSLFSDLLAAGVELRMRLRRTYNP
jgi:hypothetical protein